MQGNKARNTLEIRLDLLPLAVLLTGPRCCRAGPAYRHAWATPAPLMGRPCLRMLTAGLAWYCRSPLGRFGLLVPSVF